MKSGGSAKTYWELSRSHRYSLTYALPLLGLYELLEFVAPVRMAGGVVRNGADVLLTGLFTAAIGPRGPLVFMALVIGGALVLIWRDRGAGRLQPRIFALMGLETLALALVFGAVVGIATVKLMGPLRAMAVGAGGVHGAPALARLTLSLGAGLYEELLFRVVLVALIANGFRLLGFGRLLSGTIATVLGAVIFSAFHYLGPLGEHYQPESFVFRALAGLAFSALYLTRGFGITAWTHAVYDILVMR